MAFVKKQTIQVGDRCTTTRKVGACSGRFTTGSEVVIIGIGDRGYDIQDEFGNRVLECGWDCVKTTKE